MADELQALLDKISEEELKKADRQCEKLLTDARAEAASIVEAAKKESSMLEEKGKESLRQASRDILISLRSELEKRVTRTVENLMAANLGGSGLADVIVKAIVGFKNSDGSLDDITLLLNADELASVEAAVKASLAEDLRAHCELSPAPGIAAGFKVVFKESGIVYDFTDKSLAESICACVNPKLAAILSE